MMIQKFKTRLIKHRDPDTSALPLSAFEGMLTSVWSSVAPTVAAAGFATKLPPVDEANFLAL